MITFVSDAEKEKMLLRELKLNMSTSNCFYIVQFFGAFYVEVSKHRMFTIGAESAVGIKKSDRITCILDIL